MHGQKNITLLFEAETNKFIIVFQLYNTTGYDLKKHFLLSTLFQINGSMQLLKGYLSLNNLLL